MQQLTIAGNVGKDAELRRTGNGDPVLGFSLAVDNGKDRDGNKRDSTWYDCSIWGKRAESLQNHITKGTKLVLTGRPTARENNGKAYLGISVNELTFMGGGSEGGGQERNSVQRPAAQGNVDNYGSGGRALDDEVPFAPETRA